VGLIARAVEQFGVATTIATWNGDRTWLTKPPRVLFVKTARGSTLGAPGNAAQQRRVIEAALALVERDAPLEPVVLDEAT
jgi:hypothetical protein